MNIIGQKKKEVKDKDSDGLWTSTSTLMLIPTNRCDLQPEVEGGAQLSDLSFKEIADTLRWLDRFRIGS